MKFLKRIFLIVAVLSILFTGLLFGLGYYLNQHKEKIVEQLEAWYVNNYNGELLFNDVSVSAFKNFPSVSLTITDILLTDAQYDKHHTETLKIGELHLLVSLKKLLQREVEFKAFKLEDGEFNIITTAKGYSNKGVFKKPKTATHPVAVSKDIKLSKNAIKVMVKDFKISVIDELKKQRFTGVVNQLKTKLSVKKDAITATVNATMLVDKVGFNVDKGTFFNSALCKAEFQPTYGRQNEKLTIPSFDFKANDEVFKVKTAISFKTKEYTLDLENANTNFLKTRALLPKNIQDKLASFKISNPVFTQTSVKGNLSEKQPLITIKFYSHNNTIKINDTEVKKAVFKGDFVNRVTNVKEEEKSVKDFEIRFTELKGHFKNIKFNAKKAFVSSTPKVPLYLDAIVYSKGETSRLNSLFNNERFLFKEGDFTIMSRYKGRVRNQNHLLHNLNTSLSISKTQVHYKPLGLKLPLDTLNVVVNHKNAGLNVLHIPIKSKDNTLRLSGHINNLTDLVFNKNALVASQLHINATTFIWEDFVSVFNTERINSGKTSKRNVLYKALEDIYKTFNPKLDISVNNFDYKGLKVNDFSTTFRYKNAKNVVMERTGFSYKDGNVLVNAALNLKDDDTILFNTDVNAKNLDVDTFLKAFDYFNLDALKNTKQLGGSLSFSSKMQGLRDINGVDGNSLKGYLSFTVKDLQLEGFEPIQRIGSKIFRKQRLEHIRFAPIKNRLTVKNSVIKIPQMEISSTAFDLFLEGKLSYDNSTNLWVSVPLNNLKSRDLQEIPNKEGYINSGRKVFVNVKHNNEGKLEYKLHLTNKKLYESNGTLDVYKANQKNERVERRTHNQEKRQSKRELRKQKRLQKKKLRQTR